jgi:hypothetical protein
MHALDIFASREEPIKDLWELVGREHSSDKKQSIEALLEKARQGDVTEKSLNQRQLEMWHKTGWYKLFAYR